VHEQIYAAGGAHIPKDWATFCDQTGISAILHLNPGYPVVFHGPLPEAFLWMDVDREGQVDQTKRWTAGTFLLLCTSSGMRVLVHSSQGRHRIRWAVVAFLIISGKTVKGAISEVEKKPWLSPYHTRIDEWHAFHRSLKAGVKREY
jgi:hypothetical protein